MQAIKKIVSVEKNQSITIIIILQALQQSRGNNSPFRGRRYFLVIQMS